MARHYESRSLKHIVKHRDKERDIFGSIPDIPWKEDDLEDELELPLDNDLDECGIELEDLDLRIDAERPSLTPATCREDRLPVVREHCRVPISHYPVWERRVRLIGETRLHVTECSRQDSFQLTPLDVRFTSPPTLTREIIICGSVLARFSTGRQGGKRVALPFQRHFTAWPVQDGDTVQEELLSFAGSRICPILVSAPSGRIQRACELKVFFDALVRVFPNRHGGRCRT